MHRRIFLTIISTFLFCKSVIAHLVDPVKQCALKISSINTNNSKTVVSGPINKYVKNFKGETTSQSFFGQTKCVKNHINPVKLALTKCLKNIGYDNVRFSLMLKVANVISGRYEYLLNFEGVSFEESDTPYGFT